jgi:hypothetical protein
MTNPTGTRYPPETRRVRVQISTRSLFTDGRIIALPDSNLIRCHSYSELGTTHSGSSSPDPAPRKRGRGCGGTYPDRPPLPQARNPSLDTSVSPRSRSGWHHFAPASYLWLSVLTIGAVGLWGSQAFGQISGWHPLAPELVFGNLRICCCNARSSIILAIGRIRHKYGTGYSSSVCGV